MATIVTPRFLASAPSSLRPITHNYASLIPSNFLAISSKPTSEVGFSENLSTGTGMSVLARASPASASASASAVVSDGIADVLGEVSIFTATGEPVKFKELWDQKEGIAVVALLRHFGCFCCWELALALKESKERFDSAGVKLIAVGVGTPDKARLLAERLPFPMDNLYADPEREAYDVLGLYYGLRRTFFNPASAKVFSRIEALKKAMKNYTITATPDDKSSVLQQGGMLVFKGKQLLYARKDEGTGDHAPLDDIIDICCKVTTPA